MANEMWLIDAKEFNKKIEHIPMWGSVASYMLEHFPTVDAKPVVHGRWVNVQKLGDGTCVGFCSDCMTPHKANNLTALKMDYKYCRLCGAQMDLE